MLDAHTSLGIAQTVFYLPMVPLAIWLMVRNGRIRPRMAWWPLIPFSLSMFAGGGTEYRILTDWLVRLAGGPVIIALERDPSNIGLISAALVLLNVGVVPLIVADLGLTRLMYVARSYGWLCYDANGGQIA